MGRRSLLSTVVRGSSVFLSAVLVASCVPQPPTSYTQDTAVLRYKTSSFDMDLVELADALGYLDNIELQRVGSVQGGVESLEYLKADYTDFASIPFNGLILAQASSGAPVTAVVACSGVSKDSSSAVLVRRDHSITSMADLVGKTVGINNVGALGSAMMELYLKQAGLSDAEIASIDLRPLPVDVIEDRLFQGQVDAIWVSDNTKQRALASGHFTVLAEDVDIIGHHNTGSIVVSDSLIDTNSDAVSRLVDGVARAIEFEQTHTTIEVRSVYLDYLDKTGQASRIPTFENWKSSGISTRGGLMNNRDFNIWKEWASNHYDVSDFDLTRVYTNEFNPYN